MFHKIQTYKNQFKQRSIHKVQANNNLTLSRKKQIKNLLLAHVYITKIGQLNHLLIVTK